VTDCALWSFSIAQLADVPAEGNIVCKLVGEGLLLLLSLLFASDTDGCMHVVGRIDVFSVHLKWGGSAESW
jgi:hypothetical protein